MNNFDFKLKNMKVAIVTHVYTTGPAQELEDFLRVRVKELMFVGHPFKFSNDTRSFYRIYRDGALSSKYILYDFRAPEIILYLKDVFYTLLWILSRQGKFDLYVGADPLNSLVGIILKKIGKVKKAVLYTIDYAPKRFNNKVLNWIYHQIDSYCVRRSDFVWNLSARMIKERLKKGIDKTEHQMVVPIGVNFDRIKRFNEEKINQKVFVYMGHLRKHQGLELIVDSFSDIVSDFPGAKLMFIGGGTLFSSIKQKVIEKKLEDYVEFKGYVSDHAEVESLLTMCGIGLALYEPDSDSVTWYADPSKPKQYMACGLPVIITAVPQISEEVRLRNLGIVVEYNKKSFIQAALKLLMDKTLYLECRRNAIEFASEMRWDNIFNTALSRCL